MKVWIPVLMVSFLLVEGKNKVELAGFIYSKCQPSAPQTENSISRVKAYGKKEAG